MSLLFQIARTDRAGRGARMALRLVAGVTLAAIGLRLALLVMNPGAAILMTWGSLLVLAARASGRRNAAAVEAGRRDRLRSAAQRARDES